MIDWSTIRPTKGSASMHTRALPCCHASNCNTVSVIWNFSLYSPQLQISVVVLVLDNTIRVRSTSSLFNCINYPLHSHPHPQPLLNSQEVTSVFSHPLASFLSHESPFPQDTESLEVPYHTYQDIKWTGLDGLFRMHRFLTGREAGGTKPIFGLTA